MSSGSCRCARSERGLHVDRRGVDVAAVVELDVDRGVAQRVGRADDVDARIVGNCFSSGIATDVAIVSGLAPGRCADTLMTGNSVLGKAATGRKR